MWTTTRSRSAGALTLMIAGALCTMGCWDSGCVNGRQERVRAPDGRLDAVVFERDCGATTSASAQVAIVAAGHALPDRPGDVFTSEDNPQVSVEWASADSLVVAYERAARVSRRATHVGSVRIGYRAWDGSPDGAR